MYKHILASAGDINWMAIFALLTFFLMFVITIFVIFGKSRSYIDRMANMPLDETNSSNSETPDRHE
ncbi:MAG: hypothetical protein GYB31_02200 [Bacteroidetes bacterium]|nr:hypothetical protein [Bacteroidota bacterium]